MKKLLILIVYFLLTPLIINAQSPVYPDSSTSPTAVRPVNSTWTFKLPAAGANLGVCTDSNKSLTTTGCTFGSGGGTDGNWVFFNTSGIRLATTTNQVLIGATGTTTRNALEVIGTGYFSNGLLAPASSTIDRLTVRYATTTNATSTNISVLNLTATGSTTLQNFTGINATTSNATTTGLAITGVTSTLLKTNSTGGVIPAVSGTDYSNFGSSVGPTELQATDFGDWTCNGTTCTLDATYLTANQTITLSGDASGSGSTAITVTVADDSHAHTGSTISGLDISADTNLAVTSPIILTDDTVSIQNAAADGTTKGAASFTAADFDASSGNISIDYTNGQAASGSNKGFLTSADWTTFNNKQATISTTFPITLSGATVGFGGLTTSTPAVVGNIPYFSGVNSFANVATTTASCSGDASCTPFTVIGSSPVTISSTGGAGGSWATTSEQYYWSQFRDWSIVNGALSPTTTLGIGVYSSSTISALTVTNGTTTNATSTNLSVSGTLDIDQMTSALLLTGSTGIVAEYAGTSCTNQFVRSLDALGAATCATVANTDLANSTISGISLGSNLANLSATDSTLTFSGTYNGGTARTIGLNLGNTNTWTALQTFSTGLLSQASSTITNLQVVNGTTTNATTTNLTVSSLANCNTIDTDANGKLSCGTDEGGSGSWATTSQDYYNSQFRDWRINSAGALQPTTTRPIIIEGQSGNIGLGTTTPWGAVSVGTHNGGALEPQFVVASSSTGVATTTAFIVASNGNVGVGTTSPFANFSIQAENTTPFTNTTVRPAFAVYGGTYASAITFVGGQGIGNGGDVSFIGGQGNAGGNAGGRVIITAGDSTTATNGADVVINGGTKGDGAIDGNVLLSSVRGNTGIATTSPFMRLSVGGNAYIGGNLTATGTASTTNLVITSITGSTQCLQVNTLGQVSGTGSACGAGGSGGANSKFATSSDSMSLYPNGGIDIGVGIGTTTPHRLSDLNVASTAPAFILSDTNGSTNAKHFGMFFNDGKMYLATTSDAQNATSSAGLTYDPAGPAYFGLGTSTPFYKFSIGTGNGSSSASILVAEHRPATSTTQTIDWTNGNQQNIRIGTSAVTVTFTNFTDGATLKLVKCNPGSGTAGTITWGTEVLWSGGTAPSQTTTANKCDIYSFIGTMATSSLKVFGSLSPNH